MYLPGVRLSLGDEDKVKRGLNSFARIDEGKERKSSGRVADAVF
jgi:hypothetical protein